MPRKVKIAAVQMEATPAPKKDRLDRAAKLVADAANAGANMVILPELFSIGYAYSDANYAAAEPLSGITVTLMKTLAAEHSVYVGGTLLLLDADHVYNSALLFAPDGRRWRYDKQYPFAWERAYFREGNALTIAETDYGKFGMMICWDAAHAAVWERYAGRVDAMLIMSSPPCLHQADLCFPDGTRQYIQQPDSHFADEDMEDQAAWMHVPVIHTGASGMFSSPLPLPLVSVGFMVWNFPHLWEKLPEAHTARLEAKYKPQTRIIDASGEVLARVTQDGDSFTVATLELPDTLPQPDYDQPLINTTPVTLFSVDVVAAHSMIPLYQRGLRRQWGARMAPVDQRTQIWTAVLVVVFFVGWLMGLSARRRRTR